MTQSPRPDLYKRLISDIRVTDTLLDIGYGSLHDLITFEDSAFKNLIGLTLLRVADFKCYSVLKGGNLPVDVLIKFTKRYKLIQTDFRQYDFQKDKYSLIISNKVLHFYPDHEKLKYIDLFFQSLQSQGLLYVEINHNKHKDNTDPGFMKEIDKNVFQNKENPADIRYLVDVNDFMHVIKSKFFVLDHQNSCNENTMSFVLRK